ncbi:hypothetical protein ACFFTL_36250 [Streptomyces yanii]|uniref:Uncharacterized protein n=1 Tax=Streptomyces yanii TaxID=78510 RepID=A0ABV5RIB1_9ACTN
MSGRTAEWVMVPVYGPTAASAGTVMTAVGFRLQLPCPELLLDPK